MFYQLEIEVQPSNSEPVIEVKPKPKKIKWRWPKRILMLAVPKSPRKKYIAPPIAPRPKKTFDPLDPETAFRSDHLARPAVRKLAINKNLYKFKGDKYTKRMDKFIDKTWDSIYNYYKKRLRDRRLKRLKYILYIFLCFLQILANIFYHMLGILGLQKVVIGIIS